ncbi:hypothetical protein LUZ63_003278 [Rhynchospora breviuscula]|uniref:Rrn7/TAF1B N-terminal cyclin domain-containing protein n=1 Tax=Rhynchospora breviuscula TaxID=2022672 RepID=A0A9Q0HYK3_9POAL|nr:hypothetical protein LUZ63_003278 [Rhynchospora breviuscula]
MASDSDCEVIASDSFSVGPRRRFPSRPASSWTMSAPRKVAAEASEAGPSTSRPPPGKSTCSSTEIETIARAIRARYLEGLQVMLQKQCEVLVETFKVSPIICGMEPSMWLRYVASTGVCKDDWVALVITNWKDHRAEQAKGTKKNSSEEGAVVHFIHRTLRELIPIYSTLAVSFLACHLAREPVLPTDIVDWALEAKLPYLSFFLEMDGYIGSPSVARQMKNRTMFRPALLLGSRQLEAVAGKIAKKIGLELPPVNFYAAARRCLEELQLPMGILPRACRVYEWLLPDKIWISENDLSGFPTLVVVMSVLIITLRILYDVNGYGTWEKSLGCIADKQNSMEDCFGMESSTSSEFDASELLRVLEAVHKDIEVKHDYSKDLNSYLTYYEDVISAGMNPKLHLTKAIERCRNIFVKNEHRNMNKKRSIDVATTSFESRAHLKSGTWKKKLSSNNCDVDPLLGIERALDRMRFEMEENWFFYIAPFTKRKTKGYITYKRVRMCKMHIYAVHADYYILLRAFSKLAKVDMRLLHASTLELERKLAWFEERIRTSLNVPKDLSQGGPVEYCEMEVELC